MSSDDAHGNTLMRRWQIMLPKDVPAVRTARAAVDAWLDDAPSRERDDARLVVTELISNAVQYGRPPIQLSLERREDALRIDVADAGTRRPAGTPTTDGGGWGLRIVDRVARRWGIDDKASHVWCELQTVSRPTAAGR